jgi:hypothetical protein
LEELPRHKCGEAEHWIREPIRWDTTQPVEEDREDEHREERLDDCPQPPQNRLLVANFDVAPYEEVQKPTELPELT